MPLNIRDAEVDRLAAQMAELNRTTNTQTVKDAPRHELAPAQKKQPLWVRTAPLRAEIADYPERGVVINKAFFDELSGETDE